MKDLISRQAAIDEISEYGSIWIEYTDNMTIHEVAERALKASKQSMIRILKGLPSAQSEITIEQAIDRLYELGWIQEHDRILTESAQDRKRNVGKWMIQKYRVNRSEHDEISFYICSECGRANWTKEDNYCPNCGANMRGEKNA